MKMRFNMKLPAGLPVNIKLPKIFQFRNSQSPSLSSANSSRTSSASSSSDSSLADVQEVSGSFSGRSNSRQMRGKDISSSSTPMMSLVVDSEYQELEDAFKVFDKNGDGKISTTELREVLRSLGDDPSEEDLQLMVKEVDADGDGQIDLKEFIELNKDGAGVAARSRDLRAAFLVFDRDRNNYISAEELLQVFSQLGQPSLTIDDCCRMIQGVDSDGDGRVDFDEFERMMTSDFVS